MIFCCLLALAFLLYAPALHGEFVYDDRPSIVHHREINCGRVSWQRWRGWRPLTQWSLAVQVLIWGQHEDGRDVQLARFSMHVANVVIHAANGYFIYRILLALAFDPLTTLVATAIFFVGHPLAVNATAYISGRCALLSGFFGFAALWAYFAGYWFLCPPLIALAFFAKEDAAVLFWTVGALALLDGHLYGLAFILAPLPVAWIYRQKIRHLFASNGQKGLEAAGFGKNLEPWEYFKAAFSETVLRFPCWLLGQRQSPHHQIQRIGATSELPCDETYDMADKTIQPPAVLSNHGDGPQPSRFRTQNKASDEDLSRPRHGGLSALKPRIVLDTYGNMSGRSPSTETAPQGDALSGKAASNLYGIPRNYAARIVAAFRRHSSLALCSCGTLSHTITRNRDFIASLVIAPIVLATFFLVPDVTFRRVFILMLVSPLPLYWFIPQTAALIEYRAYLTMAGLAIAGATLIQFLPWWIVTGIAMYFWSWTGFRAFDYERTITFWRGAVRDGYGWSTAVAYNVGAGFQEAYHFEDALGIYKRILEQEPDIPAVLANMAQIAAYEKRHAEAERLLLRCTEKGPRFKGGWTQLGDYYAANNKPHKAQKCYEMAAAL